MCIVRPASFGSNKATRKARIATAVNIKINRTAGQRSTTLVPSAEENREIVYDLKRASIVLRHRCPSQIQGDKSRVL